MEGGQSKRKAGVIGRTTPSEKIWTNDGNDLTAGTTGSYFERCVNWISLIDYGARTNP
jgi:hypothetical protein